MMGEIFGVRKSAIGRMMFWRRFYEEIRNSLLHSLPGTRLKPNHTTLCVIRKPLLIK